MTASVLAAHVFFVIRKTGPVHFQWRGRPEFKAMNTDPLPTWVELDLFPLSPDRTIVRLTHRGFDDGFKYFGSAWGTVLRRLEKLCEAPAH